MTLRVPLWMHWRFGTLGKPAQQLNPNNGPKREVGIFSFKEGRLEYIWGESWRKLKWALKEVDAAGDVKVSVNYKRNIPSPKSKESNFPCWHLYIVQNIVLAWLKLFEPCELEILTFPACEKDVTWNQPDVSWIFKYQQYKDLAPCPGRNSCPSDHRVQGSCSDVWVGGAESAVFLLPFLMGKKPFPPRWFKGCLVFSCSNFCSLNGSWINLRKFGWIEVNAGWFIQMNVDVMKDFALGLVDNKGI